MLLKILAVGDVVGKPGRKACREVPALREELELDFVVVNGENAAGGAGVTPPVVEELLASGADVVTTGDHVYKNKEIFDIIGTEERLLTPANVSRSAKSRGWGVYEASGVPVGVLNLLGRTYMKGLYDNPFEAVDEIVERLSERAKVILLDFHAEATSEKVSMGWHLDGKVSVVFGTHTHVQTADERVLPGGTAYITDIGMTGPHDSVLGRRTERVLQYLTTGMPARFDVAKGEVRLSGAVFTVDAETGRAVSVERLQRKLEGA